MLGVNSGVNLKLRAAKLAWPLRFYLIFSDNFTQVSRFCTLTLVLFANSAVKKEIPQDAEVKSQEVAAQ